MSNKRFFLTGVFFLGICVTVFVGCSSFSRNSKVNSASQSDLSEESDESDAKVSRATGEIVLENPQRILLGGQSGRKERFWYYSSSVVETHETSQLVRRKEEGVEFTVESRFKPAKDGEIVFDEETIEKDGQVRLHDLAFPELNEVIEFTMKQRGEILKAGAYPSSSIFFVPTVPLPSEAVKVGDTWPFHHEWISMSSGVPLSVDLAVIFKSAYRCGDEKCALMEISGKVDLLGAIGPALIFSSDISGFMLFAIDSGTLLATRVANQETMMKDEVLMKVKSCMVGVLIEPDYSIDGLSIKQEACDPEKFIIQFEVK